MELYGKEDIESFLRGWSCDSGEQTVTKAEGGNNHTEHEEVKLIQRQKGKGQSRSNVRCWCCGEQGHVKTDCKY